MNNLLVCFSLTGSTVFLIYNIYILFFDKFLTAKLKYKLLKIVLVFFIVPFSYFRWIIEGILKDFFLIHPTITRTYNIDPLLIITLNPDGLFYSHRIKLTIYILFICFSIAILLFSNKMYKYVKVKKTISYGLKIPSALLLEGFEEIKSTVSMKRKVRLRISQGI